MIPETIRIALIDHSLAFLEAFPPRLAEEHDLEIVGIFTDSASALGGIALLRPDVVIIDFLLPDTRGFHWIADMHRAAPAMQIMALTHSDDARHIIGFLQAGGNGYLLKPAPTGEIIASIRSIHAGGSPMSASISRKLVDLLRLPKNPSSQALAALSERENSVMELLAQGLIAKEVADHLGIRFTTARFHIRRIYQKLKVRSRTEALMKYHGLHRASP